MEHALEIKEVVVEVKSSTLESIWETKIKLAQDLGMWLVGVKLWPS